MAALICNQIKGRDLDAPRTAEAKDIRNGADERLYYERDPRGLSDGQSLFEYHGVTVTVTEGKDGKPPIVTVDKDGRGALNGRGAVVPRTWANGVATLDAIEFVTVPKGSEFKAALGGSTVLGGQGLTFHYLAQDLGGNAREFQVFVPTRANEAPSIDNYAGSGTPTGGDITSSNIPDPGGVGPVWATSPAAEDSATSWVLRWSDQTNGLDPATYRVADSKAAFPTQYDPSWSSSGSTSASQTTADPRGLGGWRGRASHARPAPAPQYCFGKGCHARPTAGMAGCPKGHPECSRLDWGPAANLL